VIKWERFNLSFSERRCNMYIYHYSRYLAPDSRRHETLDEAIEDAYGDMEHGTAWPLRVERDGEVVLDYDALHANLSALRDERDNEEEYHGSRSAIRSSSS
jgi:hypothetical protein